MTVWHLFRHEEIAVRGDGQEPSFAAPPASIDGIWLEMAQRGDGGYRPAGPAPAQPAAAFHQNPAAAGFDT